MSFGLTCPQPAHAAGGAAGSGVSGTGGGGGVTSQTGTGGAGGGSSVANTGTTNGGGGGGGGAGATGGSGGQGAATSAPFNGAGGAGGASAGAAGQSGTNGSTFGAGGGGGGAHGGVSASLPTGNLTGGRGGNGGASTGGGGGGGAGGYGAVITGNGLSGTIAATIAGGDGGNGGNFGTIARSSGGDGGIGLVFTDTGNQVELLSSAVISGGNGGAGGILVSNSGPLGAGGAGIVGQDLTLIVGGSVSGGLSGSTRANAITFSGGNNRLELRTGYAFTGNVVGGGSDTLTLGGTVAGSFDSSAIGGQFTGFTIFDKRGSGTWTLTGTGGQDWTVQDGILQVDGTAGAITAQSSGTATINGTAGDINAQSGGTVVVNGTAGNASVQSGGLLGGIGIVGAVTVASGGIHAPGNSIGTQTINGNYINSGTLRIEASPSAADKLIVNGTVNITGSTLDLVLSPSTNASWSSTNGPFVIIENNSGSAVTGTFSPITKNLLFLDETLDYAGGDGNDVTLLLTRNDISFASVALTPNQTATAGAVETLGSGNPINDAIALSTDPDVVRANYDALSGEVYAAAQTALIGSSHFLRDAMTDRLRSAFNGVASTSTALLAYAGDGLPDYAPSPTERLVIWGTAMGSWGSTDGDGNSARLDTSSGGFLGGADGKIENWRLGLMAGVSRTDFDSDARRSSGDSDNYHVGAYAGTQWGGFALRTGVTYTWHDIASARSVSIPGFADYLEADYDARTIQALAEVGYRLDVGAVGVEPFANVAYVNFDEDGFTERGGAAALSSNGQTTDTTYTTLGARASTKFLTGVVDATARGSLGWQHAFGDTTPVSRVAFAGGSPFTVSGAPIAEDAAVVAAGLDFNLSPSVTLGIAYGGQFGSDVTDQSVNANLSIRF